MSPFLKIQRVATFFLALSLQCGFGAHLVRAESDSPWRWSGPHLRATERVQAFLRPISGYPSAQNRLDLEGETTLQSERWGFRLVPWVWVSSPDTRAAKTKKTRLFFEAKEAWGEYTGTHLAARAGNQIVSWGAADLINPTDHWNPLDLSDPFRSAKLPLPLLRLQVNVPELEDHRLEVIATPFFRESRLPLTFPSAEQPPLPFGPEDTRWLIGLPTQLQTGGILFPLKYQMAPISYPATWQAGARYQLLRVGSWDFSSAIYSGVEKTPRMYLAKKGDASDPALPLTVTLNPSFHRETLFGLDGAGAVADSNLTSRIEAAWVLPSNGRALAAGDGVSDSLIAEDRFHGVFGLDYTFETTFFGTVLYLNSMFVLEEDLTHRRTSASLTDSLEGLPATTPWNRDIVALLEDRIGSNWKIRNTVIYSIVNRDAFYSPSILVQWNDQMSGSLSADFFFGKKSGFFGQYRDNSRIELSVTYEI